MGITRKPDSKHCYDYPRPAVTVDVVLLRRGRRDRLEVLLIERARDPFRGRWALPGGFVDQDEGLAAAAKRELEEETGLRGIELRQFGAFGDPGRDPRGHTVSIAFTAFLSSDHQAIAADDAADVGWHPALRPPPLAFDHHEIIRAALRHWRQ